MTRVQEMAKFVTSADVGDLSRNAVTQLKIRVLDALGCAFGALDALPVQRVGQLTKEFGGAPLCTLIGGGATAPDRAAFYNGALVRYLDFNDSFLAKGETCHPSDNVAPVLAAAEYADASGEDFLVGLAVAYQVQCRLSEVAPVRSKGFDHTTQGAYAVAAGESRALGMSSEAAANAIAISGTALNALRVTRTGGLSNWKGLAYPFTAFAGTIATFLAKSGITGPAEVFEGNKGFVESISGPFTMDWSKEDLEAVTRTIIKKYNSEIHSQSAVECILELRRKHKIDPKDILSIQIKTFDVGYNIIGGGEEGEKKSVRTKEEADHSLPYIVSAALLDGEMTPEQFDPKRILRKDVQSLLRLVSVSPDTGFSAEFPGAMPTAISVKLRGGTTIEGKRKDYEGFFTRPMSWNKAVDKFEKLASRSASRQSRNEVTEIVSELDSVRIKELTKALRSIQTKKGS